MTKAPEQAIRRPKTEAEWEAFRQRSLDRLARRFGDEAIKAHFRYKTMSPEEYAARVSHTVGCYNYHTFQYRDPEVGAWARRLGEILTDPDEADRCRREHLTPAEYQRVQERIAEVRDNPHKF